MPRKNSVSGARSARSRTAVRSSRSWERDSVERERGVDGTAFSDVIERSGAPRGSIYHHFPGGKAELAGEAVDYVGGLARDAIADPLDDGDPVRALRAFVELWRADFERSGGRAGCPIAA